MHSARRLVTTDVARLGKRGDAEPRRRREPPAFNREHVEPVLALERDVDPRLCRVKIEVPRTKAVAAVRGDRHLAGQQAIAIVEDL